MQRHTVQTAGKLTLRVGVSRSLSHFNNHSAWKQWSTAVGYRAFSTKRSTKMLEDKVAIVTGGASGIGKACAKLFIEEGAKVVIADWNAELGKKIASELGPNAIFLAIDTSKPDDQKKLVDETVKKFGALHIAVNNAGISGETNKVADLSLEGWKKVIDVNLNGVFYGMHFQIPALLKTGGGSIINMSSILGAIAMPSFSAYTSAKHGILGLTKCAAWEYGTSKIRVNAVGPAVIETPMVSQALDKPTQEAFISNHALHRLGKPEEVAELVLWLASDRSSFATGTYYPIDAGWLAQ